MNFPIVGFCLWFMIICIGLAFKVQMEKEASYAKHVYADTAAALPPELPPVISQSESSFSPWGFCFCFSLYCFEKLQGFLTGPNTPSVLPHLR